MNKRYRLGEIEEAVSEMEELIGLEDDIAEIDDDFQIVVSGWSVYVESLNLALRQGIACVWDAEEGLYMPDFDVTIVYEGNIETQEWLYNEQDGMVVTLGNWLNGRLSCEQIEQLYIKGFATVVFGDSFKITNIAILENKDKGELFVSMPRYRSNERDESNGVIYKDVCNPITAEFREELYTNILDAYARIKEPEKEETQKQDRTQEMPEFSVTVTPYEREGSNIKGLARIYFENSFIVNNINIVQGKEKIFVSMPSYKTKQVDEQGKPIYQDVCYPVTKDFRERLYNEIISEYEKAKDKSNEKARESAEKHHGNPDKEKDKEATPFR